MGSVGCCENGDGYETPPEEGEPKAEDNSDSEGAADRPCEGHKYVAVTFTFQDSGCSTITYLYDPFLKICPDTTFLKTFSYVVVFF